MGVYAIIDQSGLCLNTAVWDGETPYVPPDETTLVRIDEISPQPARGWTGVSPYDSGNWQPPAATPSPDLVGFTRSVQSPTNAMTALERASMVGWLAALNASLLANDLEAISTGWANIKSAGILSSDSTAFIVSQATAFNIPDIS